MSIFEFAGALEFGLVFALMGLGVYLSFRVLDFPDLTVDGSFPLGAGLAAALILAGFNPWLATVAAMAAGFAAGALTGVIAMKMRILNLLASIVVMTGLYSINLHIMGAPNLSLIDQTTVFSQVGSVLRFKQDFMLNLTVYGCLVALVLLTLHIFFKTNLGLAIRATGDNAIFAKSVGVNTDGMVILGVGAANALVALSGALYAQSQLTADIGMGLGTIVAGLAAVIIGECLGISRKFWHRIAQVVLGSIFYRVVISFAISMSSGDAWWSLSVNDLNLITAVTVLLFLGLTGSRAKFLKRAV